MHDPRSAARITAVANALQFARETGETRTVTVPWEGGENGQLTVPVIRVPLDSVVLNHNSHRVIAQLENHPQRALLEADPFGDKAQALLAGLLKASPFSTDFSVVDPAYNRLKDDLHRSGQKAAGVVTHDGVLFNANTRAVALRELGVSHILLGVLPSTASPEQLEDVELGLQLQPTFEREYAFTNYLKTVDRLVQRRGIAKAAAQLNRKPAEIEMAMRVLGMIRDIQERSAVLDSDGVERTLPLTWFNDKQQSLEEIDRALRKTTGKDRIAPAKRETFRATRLLAILAGAPKLDVRAAGEDHFETYVRPRLPKHLTATVTPAPTATATIPGLGVSVTTAAPTAPADVSALLTAAAAARTATAVLSPTDPKHAEGKNALASIEDPILDGLAQAKLDRRRDDRLDSPARKVSDAGVKLDEVLTGLGELLIADGFDREALREAVTHAQDALARIAAAIDDADASDETGAA